MSYGALRQEVMLMSKLQHPCIVSLLGVCAPSLCYMLELSPIGSLREVLKKAVRDRETGSADDEALPLGGKRTCVLGRLLSYRILFQVGNGYQI